MVLSEYYTKMDCSQGGTLKENLGRGVPKLLISWLKYETFFHDPDYIISQQN